MTDLQLSVLIGVGLWSLYNTYYATLLAARIRGNTEWLQRLTNEVAPLNRRLQGAEHYMSPASEHQRNKNLVSDLETMEIRLRRLEVTVAWVRPDAEVQEHTTAQSEVRSSPATQPRENRVKNHMFDDIYAGTAMTIQAQSAAVDDSPSRSSSCSSGSSWGGDSSSSSSSSSSDSSSSSSSSSCD